MKNSSKNDFIAELNIRMGDKLYIKRDGKKTSEVFVAIGISKTTDGFSTVEFKSTKPYKTKGKERIIISNSV